MIVDVTDIKTAFGQDESKSTRNYATENRRKNARNPTKACRTRICFFDCSVRLSFSQLMQHLLYQITHLS
jgi:hypothetical protein